MRYANWVQKDPAGQHVDSVRPIRDEIVTRLEALTASFAPIAKYALPSPRRPGPEWERRVLKEDRM
ncbi:hypothetical protein BJG92_03452 [Arthrobacter sp. SO5]|uniref:hypothetical protein n=1 Tax=Arthrobacter sp. SO5 TaxID=1897055 RepID=UPI001E49F881|nr:hypothetical protein [Arthrobacter sp. SO5]MCB5275898.1 hypothetical protein [Arthrobacter sp. SO5]